MSEDAWKGWYRDEKPSPAGAGPAPEATHDMTVAAPTPGGAGAGAPVAAGPAGTRDRWPEQPPVRSGYQTEPDWTRRVSGGTSGGSGGGAGFDGGGWRRRWLRPKRILLILATFVVLVLLAGVITYFDLNSKLSRANVLVDYQGRPAATAGTNWLITGSDSRGGLTRSQENQLALGHDIGGGRSDTIMLLHIPANGTRPVLVSIPRDSYVQIPGYGWNKINAAYAFGGPKLLAETVQNVTGLRVNHYMGIGLGGLVNVVNSLGGVRMCLPAAMNDPKAGLHLKKGCQNLSGAQALGFTRTRAFGLGDLQRVADQRLLLSAVLKKMTSTGTMINPFASIPAVSGAASSLTVDSGVQLYQLLSVGFALKNPESTSVPFGSFDTTNVGSVIRWNHAAATELFRDLATDKAVPKNLLSGTAIQGTA
jgi:LCP family protein required for cell wall assembly